MWLLRLLSSLVFLFLIIFTIPLAFDVGGRECGLAFSLSLAVYYFLYSILRLATPEDSRFRYAFGKLVASTQWLMILTLMIWSLNKFSVDSDSSSGGWVERTFNYKRSRDTSVKEWIFGRGGLLEELTVRNWDKFLRYSTPVFQLLEGFCSLLVIQAAGQLTRWLVNQDGGDTYATILLVPSASIISGSMYFLYRITTFPDISNVDNLLIGAAIACVIFLATWGIVSGRGNPVESSLLFAYFTLSIYQIFTDYQPSPSAAASQPPPPAQPALPPLPPIIMASYTTLVHALSTLPSAIHGAFAFFWAAVMTITPSVIISLAYRVFVMYAAARIIPAVHEYGASALATGGPELGEGNEDAAQALQLLSAFAPSILIAVYTSLLMQHFSSTSGNGGDVPGAAGDWWTSQGGDAGGNLWRWLNIACTMGLYAVELWIQREDDGFGFGGGAGLGHWKID